MKTLMIVFFILLLISIAEAKQLKVAVIDTGYNGLNTHLCADGHFDFIKARPEAAKDIIGHGTQVTNAIQTYAKDSNYCVLVYRVFAKAPYYPRVPEAVMYAIAHHADIINLSLEGPTFAPDEFLAIKRALAKGIEVYVAAGNGNKNLDFKCNVYPACYKVKGLTVVGSTPVKGRRTGNTGNIVSQKEDSCFGGLCGTSLSTGIATGKFINKQEKR